MIFSCNALTFSQYVLLSVTLFTQSVFQQIAYRTVHDDNKVRKLASLLHELESKHSSSNFDVENCIVLFHLIKISMRLFYNLQQSFLYFHSRHIVPRGVIILPPELVILLSHTGNHYFQKNFGVKMAYSFEIFFFWTQSLVCCLTAWKRGCSTVRRNSYFHFFYWVHACNFPKCIFPHFNSFD